MKKKGHMSMESVFYGMIVLSYAVSLGGYTGLLFIHIKEHRLHVATSQAVNQMSSAQNLNSGGDR